MSKEDAPDGTPDAVWTTARPHELGSGPSDVSHAAVRSGNPKR